MERDTDLRSSYDELCSVIREHMRRYYDEDAPTVTDAEYDAMMRRLKAMEREHPELITPESPTQIIGGTARREAGVKVTHNIPMLSIEDVFTKEEVGTWIAGVQQRHPGCAFSVETKIDGLSMTLRYRRRAPGEELYLELAETRGDGRIGEDVTANARLIPDVPGVLPASLPGDYIELRGEVYMDHEAFERFNEEQRRQGRKEAANPRNLAAGTLRQLDPEVTKRRGLRLFIFNVQEAAPELMEEHCAALDILGRAGVPVVRHIRCDSTEEVYAAIDTIGESRGELAYDLDGAVVKLDHTAWRSEFPAGSKYASGHIAYKYPPEERVVVMDEILTDVGRTGKLTFTGVFHDRETGRPARLCGTNVSRATLHNMDYIRELRIGVGGAYTVYKSGEIIPRISGLVTEPPAVYEAPEVCPVCGHRLIKEEGTVDIMCVNNACPAQISRTLTYFCSRDAMNIMGLGETLIDALAREGYLRDCADIYHLREHRGELIERGLIGKEKNTDKVLEEIERSKSADAVRLLTGLAIRNVGLSTARELMRHVSDIMELSRITREALTELPDIGETTAGDIYDFFHDEENRRLLERLAEAGVNMARAEDTGVSQALAGKTIVVTGTLPTLGRREVEALITQHGGKATGSVSKKTDYLVAGEAAGSKLDKARALGIPVITEAELIDMIGEGR